MSEKEHKHQPERSVSSRVQQAIAREIGRELAQRLPVPLAEPPESLRVLISRLQDKENRRRT